MFQASEIYDHFCWGVMEKLLYGSGSVNYSSMNYSAGERFDEI